MGWGWGGVGGISDCSKIKLHARLPCKIFPEDHLKVAKIVPMTKWMPLYPDTLNYVPVGVCRRKVFYPLVRYGLES